jgi:hypothetical protein
MSAVTIASHFLLMVESCKHLDNTVRVDPNVYCYMHRERDMEFIATDESDWFGKLTVQWPTIPPHDLAMNVDSLLGKIGNGKLPMLFHYEVHEVWGVIRAEYRLPIYTELMGQEDVDDAVMMLYLEWSTVRPFIQRVLDGEDVESVAAEAIPAMEAMRNR